LLCCSAREPLGRNADPYAPLHQWLLERGAAALGDLQCVPLSTKHAFPPDEPPSGLELPRRRQSQQRQELKYDRSTRFEPIGASKKTGVMFSISRFAAFLEKLTGEVGWKRYLLAICFVCCALIVRELLVITLGINLFAVLFPPTVILAGLACGLGPGLLAAVLGTMLPFVHFTGGIDRFFPSSADILMNTVVLGLLNLLLAFVGASHREHERRIQLTMRELTHRTKNLLSVITSISRQLARGTNNIEAFREEFDKRVQSIALAHDLIVSNQWRSSDLHSVIELAVDPFVDKNRISLQGRQLSASPLMIENVVIAVHELLASSAMPDPASRNGGKIEICWRVEQDRLQFEWQAAAASAQAPPDPSGFGQLVLTHVVPRNLQGKATYAVEEGRVRWALSVPLRHFGGTA
jgi:two-component sensor histidine kinase